MKWHLGYALPNIIVPQSREGPYVAIVPPSDSRVAEIIQSSESASRLLTCFYNSLANKIGVSALIYKSNAPETIKSEMALLAFRNLVAVCSICPAWATGDPTYHHLFSDYFDVYPVIPGKNGSLVLIRLDYQDVFPATTTFAAMPTKLMPSKQLHIYDEDLHICLTKYWAKHFGLDGNGAATSTSRLLRSMEMAYRAAALPDGNHISLNDLGSQLVMWVSALEILAHPGRGKVGRGQVDALVRPHVTRFLPGLESFVQRLCKELYAARNDFIHGNPVSPSRLYFDEKDTMPLLMTLAPIFYRLTLGAYVVKHGICSTDSGLAGTTVAGSLYQGALYKARRVVEGH